MLLITLNLLLVVGCSSDTDTIQNFDVETYELPEKTVAIESVPEEANEDNSDAEEDSISEYNWLILNDSPVKSIQNPNTPQANVVNLEEFGGVPNDDTVDNTPALTDAISYLLTNNGGTLQFNGGIYEFKTPFTSTAPLSSIKIQGVGMWAGYPNATGTLLNFSGSGYFLNLIQGGQYSILKDFSIDCNGADGIKLKEGTMSVNKFTIEKVRINGFRRGIDIQDFAYVYLEKLELLAPYSFYKINNSVEFGIRIGAGAGIKEFIYISDTNVDAAASGNDHLDAGVSGTGIEIRDSNNVYITNCDIANWGSGKALYLHTVNNSIWGIFIKNLNVVRADGGIEFFEDNDHITQVSIQDLMFVHRGRSKNERGIYNHKNGNKILLGAYFDKVYFRKLGTTSPTYDIQIKGDGDVKLGYYSSLSGGVTVGTK